MREAGYFKFGK